MKNITTIPVLLFLLMPISFKAQEKACGLYLSSDDYLLNKVSFNSDTSKIKLHDVFYKNHIEVSVKGKKYRFNKDSIFGYQTCDKADFKFTNTPEKELQILENRTITIYAASLPSSTSGKAIHFVTSYFFSKGINTSILPLTISNLKKTFPENLKFHDLLDVEFSDGTPLSTYDPKNKMYKINFLLFESTDKK